MDHRPSPLDIYSSQEIYVGRDSKTCRLVVEDLHVSNRHLRIYTVLFDKDNPGEVSPLVYAQDLSRNGTLWNGSPMGKKVGGVLLSDGDILALSPGYYLEFRCGNFREESPFENTQLREMELFGEYYTLTSRKLGSGAYGKVHMAIDRETGGQLACKIVDLSRFKRVEGTSKFFPRENGLSARRLSREVRRRLKAYDREANVLQMVCHPNIIGLEMVIKTTNTVYLFQELITAGDLFSFLERRGGRLGDIEAAVVVRQILLALEYLHERDIVHRDLKPDNILMTSLADGCRVVLTDFGCARFVKPRSTRMGTLVGTFEYSAPEVVLSKSGYTKAVDLWSVGCIAAVLLTGGSPFRDPSTYEYSVERARRCDLELLEMDLRRVHAGKRATDFIRRLLVLDEMERMDVKQAVQHNWFTNAAHRQGFEELYRRAIQNWEPRQRRAPMVLRVADDLRGSPTSSSALHSGSLRGDTPLSSEVYDEEIPEEHRSGCSITLSDPEGGSYRRKRLMKASNQMEQSCGSLVVYEYGIQQTEQVEETSPPVEEGVYEEVDNCITGEKRHIPYGYRYGMRD
ncbi:hypothetical protein ASPZODRAFT_92708 [Penicilliopsis zonata CBS 506.65]|uniref:Uncharacterized protein n=1 Tax=Penicilliopsis zonata CBS 506.65 TaxID=1073090 RepID=A0A1L9SM49_9EURO|nr:hypothetical protein ASPZODRAFT_92708 [Penicilliopsis zonata CBS 506.65]OJJ48268.1 hypothetical protein ASPZODRAFT_92708 [Penicilliopsis zonata CBS 506.65]